MKKNSSVLSSGGGECCVWGLESKRRKTGLCEPGFTSPLGLPDVQLVLSAPFCPSLGSGTLGCGPDASSGHPMRSRSDVPSLQGPLRLPLPSRCQPGCSWGTDALASTHLPSVEGRASVRPLGPTVYQHVPCGPCGDHGGRWLRFSGFSFSPLTVTPALCRFKGEGCCQGVSRS